jgi:hypothetical protein
MICSLRSSSRLEIYWQRESKRSPNIIPVIWPSRPRSRPPVIRAQMLHMRRRLGPRVAGAAAQAP